MERSLKIFFACVFGAGIGALVALEMHSYFWWIGLLTGALLGYLSYDFKKVLWAVPKAYKMARKGTEKACSWNWLFMLALFIFSITMTFFIVLIYIIFDKSLWRGLEISLSVSIWGPFLLYDSVRWKPNRETRLKDAKWVIENLNLFTVLFYHLPGILMTFLSLIGKFIWRFGKAFFVLIHSERRLICAVDSAIGAGIGFFAGSVIIGAIAGGLLGVLNYEIISKRVLKLAPR